MRAAEERVTLAAKALRRYLDHTPTNEVCDTVVLCFYMLGARACVCAFFELHFSVCSRIQQLYPSMVVSSVSCHAVPGH